MKTITLTTLLFVLAIIVSACGGAAQTEAAPPEILYGQDICEFCGMIVSDPRYAAGYLTPDGGEHIFDDIGNMFQSHLQNHNEVRAFFVHDHETQSWIRAETAYYVKSSKLLTPMLHGLAASATPEKAKALATKVDGQVLTFDEVIAHYQKKVAVTLEDHTQHQHQ